MENLMPRFERCVMLRLMLTVLAVEWPISTSRGQAPDVEVQVVGLREKIPDEQIRIGIYADGSFHDLLGHEINLERAFKRVFAEGADGKELRTVNILVHVRDPKDTPVQVLMEALGTIVRTVPKAKKAKIYVRS